MSDGVVRMGGRWMIEMWNGMRRVLEGDGRMREGWCGGEVWRGRHRGRGTRRGLVVGLMDVNV